MIGWNSTAVDNFDNWNTTLPMQRFNVSNKAPIFNISRQIPNQTIQEDNYTLYNITSFYDPDGDSLTYNAVLVQNITITFIGSIMNITPEANFNGTRNVIKAAIKNHVKNIFVLLQLLHRFQLGLRRLE